MMTFRIRRRASARLISVVGLSAAALIGVSATAVAQSTVTPRLVVANYAGSTLTTYPLSASGNATPGSTVSAQARSLDAPEKVALDAAGDLWVANSSGNTIVEYTQSQLAATGAPTPAVTLSASSGNLDGPIGLAFDSAGDLWVSNATGDTLVEFTASQLAGSGAPTPAVTIASDSLNNPGELAFDNAGDLWVPNDTGSGGVLEFTPSQLAAGGNLTPAVTLSSDASASLAGSESLVFDAAGALWVSDSGSGGNTLVKYEPSQLTATGSPTPAVTLTLAPANGASEPGQAAFDASGDLWVATFEGGPNGAGSIVELAPSQLTATGTETPIDTITGPATGLDATGLNGSHGLAIMQAPTVGSVSPAAGSAAGGTVVTVSGTGFYPGATVDFGAVSAAVTYVSPYQLRVLAPAGAGTVDVRVTTGMGTSATSAADSFTYATAPVVMPPVVMPPVVMPPVVMPTPAPRARLRFAAHALVVAGPFADVPLICSGAACHGRLRITERVSVRVRRGKRTVRRERTVVLGSGRYVVGAGHRVTFRVRLGVAARGALARARDHRLVVVLTATVPGARALEERAALIERVHHHRRKKRHSAT